jgi:hypothetical protein
MARFSISGGLLASLFSLIRSLEHRMPESDSLELSSSFWKGLHVRPVSVLRRDALTSQLFRRPELIDLRLGSYRNSSLTPRTKRSPWSGYEEFRRAVLSIQVSRNFTGTNNRIDVGKAGRIVITREE